jgi:hypothetical protein
MHVASASSTCSLDKFFSKTQGLLPIEAPVRPLGSDIISGLIAQENIMEAERINSLQSLLDDLTTRAAELRRYL